MMRRGLRGWRLAIAMGAGMVSAPIALAQAGIGATVAAACSDASLAAYDVVSVKEAHPERVLSVGAREMPDGINGEYVPVSMMVQQAYSKERSLPLEDAVTGLPDWTKMPNYYSVQAKMSPEQVAAFNALDKDVQRACRTQMLQALLEDRFKLKVHKETRQLFGYDLLVDKGGPRFQETTGPDPNAPKRQDGTPITGSYMSMHSGKNGGLEITVHGYTMQQVAGILSQSNLGVNHRVVDKTGLTGKYSFNLDFTPSSGVGPAGESADASDPGPTIFNALEDQAGLRLQRAAETIDVVVVDHVERPAAN
jgi:uncharacterized protein (TIGR03435 family)